MSKHCCAACELDDSEAKGNAKPKSKNKPSPVKAKSAAKSSEWLQAVGSIDCCVLCGGNYMLQVAHRNMGRGKGQKAPDYETARLCQECHYAIDNGKDLAQIDRRELMHRAIVKTHSILIRSGRLILIKGGD